MMSRKERYRLLTLSRVHEKGMRLKDAACVLSLSYRQTRRIYQRYLEEGDAGLVHTGRGKRSNRGFGQTFKAAVLARYENRYKDFGPTLAVEKLAEDGFHLDHETLRRWLLSAGLIKRRRRRAKYRKLRKRSAHFGELVQMDGSHHAWFEERGEPACLMNMIDDATGVRLSLMDEEETTEVAMRVLWSWIERYGIPEALYVDRKNVFVTDREPTIEEQLKGEEPLTYFGKALKKLSIKITTAHSPQAKGRVERCHGVFQDRFVKEMRLLGVDTIEEATKLLCSGFVDSLNDKFSREPADEVDRHRPLRKGEDLAAIFSYEDERTIGNDFTIRYQGRIFQIKKQADLPCPGKRLTVQKRLDKSIHLIYRDRGLLFDEISEVSRVTEANKTRGARKVKPAAKYIPPANHPWRKGWGKPSITAAPR